MHFRTELSCEKDLNDEYRAVIETLDQFYQDVNREIGQLEKALQQIDKYQHEIQLLKQKLIQEEQLLKTMTPDQPADYVQVRVCLLSHNFAYHFSFSHRIQRRKNLLLFFFYHTLDEVVIHKNFLLSLFYILKLLTCCFVDIIILPTNKKTKISIIVHQTGVSLNSFSDKYKKCATKNVVIDIRRQVTRASR